MKKIITVLVSFAFLLALSGCSMPQSPEQEEVPNVQYFFSGQVLEVQEEYLTLEVYYIGNTNLSEGATVEVSTDVVAAAGCPKFEMGENARVVMAWNTEEAPTGQLNALAIYKEDAEGNVYSASEELPEATPTPVSNQ